MAIIQGNAKSADAGGFYPKEIEQSLRFNDNDSAYLSWTPASAGNRKTWTFSAWVKRGNIDSSVYPFGSTSGTTETTFRFNSSTGALQFYDYNGGAKAHLVSSAYYRDVSAWYHIVISVDTTQATASDRINIYVNGELLTNFSTETYYSTQNYDTYVNSTNTHTIGQKGNSAGYFDGYLSEVHFTDGTAYDATAFGEFKNGVWVAKQPDVTYGTNGFYLPFRNDYTVEGFSTVTYRGTGANTSQYIGGVGYNPDLVWIKRRDGSGQDHVIMDSVRGYGPTTKLSSSSTSAENNTSSGATDEEWGYVSSSSSDGFTVTGSTGADQTNEAGWSYVAWCWDAGTGSPVSNTDGSITSTVKANPDRGFSIVSWAGNGNVATIGHGLSSAPDMVILKSRSLSSEWFVYHSSLGGTKNVRLNQTNAEQTTDVVWNNTDPTSSVFSTGSYYNVNASGNTFIAYCFHSVSGYSDFGSYTGTSATHSITTGFKPAMVMIKRTDSAAGWAIFDNVRDAANPRDTVLFANVSDADYVEANAIDFDDTGFTINVSYGYLNLSSASYIYMAFADTREAAFWLDDSGNNNDWENNNLTESDIVLDSPTNNFATLNPLGETTSTTYFEGNTSATRSSVGTAIVTSTSALPTSGSWYVEFLPRAVLGAYPVFGGYKIGQTLGGTNPSGADEGFGYESNGTVSWYTTSYNSTSGFTALTANDILSVAYNADNGKFWFAVNGVWQNGNPATDTMTTGSAMSTDTQFGFGFGVYNGVTNPTHINFGQDSSFAGNKVPQGYTDANGRGDFYYAPPTGYLALCTANLPEPVIGPNSASTSDEHFNTVLYTGTGATQSITGVGFQPDLLWTKNRTAASEHRLRDAIRGVTAVLQSSTTSAEIVDTYVDSFDIDGFTVNSNHGSQNYTGYSYVAWNWKANGSGVTNTDGSITSTVSANTDAGFSIVSYTGNGTAGATIGHGLSSAPDMMIVKNRDTAGQSWMVYHSGNTTAPETDFLRLESTNATQDYNGAWDDTLPTSSVFTVRTDTNVNASGIKYIAYCFHSVDGFSKFGSYTGNGSADGPFVHLGFKPAFILWKNVDSGIASWHMMDTARDTYNVTNKQLKPNSSNAEQTVTALDVLSNGFKWRDGQLSFNASGNNYIYMAFAESGGPFKYSRGR